jgi:hypothetical protein
MMLKKPNISAILVHVEKSFILQTHHFLPYIQEEHAGSASLIPKFISSHSLPSNAQGIPISGLGPAVHTCAQLDKMDR